MGVGIALRHDDLRVIGAVAADVRDRRVEVVHHAHRQHRRQVLLGPVALGGRPGVAEDLTDRLVAPQLDTLLV